MDRKQYCKLFDKKYNEFIKQNINRYDYYNNEIEEKTNACNECVDKIEKLINNYRHETINLDELYSYIQANMTNYIFHLNKLTIYNQFKESFENQAKIYATEETSEQYIELKKEGK